ncbi:hypothetical protein AB0B15_10525 [Streptomyces sp. NPDC045456]|uniref:hypothetical protein n=1 Tax=Streptomyces sp. NPDC045456 TaxID=3155254 RepID=UPI0034063553
MSWRYDVYVCPAPDAPSHGPHCHDRMEQVEGAFHDYGYRDAFKLAHERAEEHGHAAVWSTFSFNGKTALVYQHIRGGGLCEDCGPATGRRGPWTRSVAFEKFLCVECTRSLQAASDEISKAMGVTRWRSVRPVIEDADR